MYDELLDDPKVQRLPADDFKGWVNLLALASRNNGKLPSISDIAFALRETEESVSTLLERLLNGGLIECRNGGADGRHYAPYRWAERQYKSDTSTDRVKRFRQRSKTAPETPPDTETETDTEVSDAKASSPRAWACPVAVDPQIWTDLLSNRKRKRHGNTLTAWKRFNDDLDRISQQTGIPPPKLIEHAAASGWAGIYDPRERSDERTNGMARHQSDGLSSTARAALDVFGGARN
jgi:predicted transcriptional regulator